MKDKDRDRGSQINVGEREGAAVGEGWRATGRVGARRGEGRQTGSSAGAEVGVPRQGRGESRCYLQASAGLSLSLLPGTSCGTIRRGRPDSGRARGWKGAAAAH